MDYDYINNFCDEIIEKNLNIKWSDSVRSDCLDKELILKMKKAGCIALTFGIESGSDSTLKRMKKGIISKKSSDILRWSSSAGIFNIVNFIVGFPQESDEDFQETLDFIRQNINFIHSTSLNKFILHNSDILINPLKYGIETTHSNKFENNSSSPTFTFNEINGLKWDELVKKANTKWKTVISLFAELKGGNCTRLEDLYKIYHMKNE